MDVNKGIAIGIAIAITIGIAAVAAVSMDEPSSGGGLDDESFSEITIEETATEGKKITVTLTEKLGIFDRP